MAISELPPMGYKLSDDSRSLVLQFDGQANSYTTDQIETLIILLTLQRARMQPSVPETPALTQPDRVIVASAYRLQVDPDHGLMQVWAQHPGFGWSVVEIPAAGAGPVMQQFCELANSLTTPVENQTKLQ